MSMSSIRMLAAPCIMALCLMAASFAQDGRGSKEESGSGSQVEVKTDRFSGDVTVSMKPQTLIDTPDRKLTMVLKYRLNKKEVEAAPVLLEELASIIFESAVKESFEYGDEELHFIVDGKQLAIGQTSSDLPDLLLSTPTRDERGRRPSFSFHAGLFLSQVEQLARGKQIEMRLGTVELTLSQSTLVAIREFAREFVNHAPTRTNRKGSKRW